MDADKNPASIDKTLVTGFAHQMYQVHVVALMKRKLRCEDTTPESCIGNRGRNHNPKKIIARIPALTS